jgi:hypothetical protein
MSKHRDVMRALAAARPGHLDPGPRPDPATIMSVPRRVERRPARRLLLAGLVPAAAAVVVGAVVVGTAGGTVGADEPVRRSEPPTNTVPGSARALFLVAAERSAAGTADSGRYWVVGAEHGERRTKGPAGRRYDIMLRGVDEQWQATRAGDETVVAQQNLGAAPVTAADRAAWRADGSPALWVEQPPFDLPDAPAVVIKAAPEPMYRRPIDDPTRRTTYVFAGREFTVAQLAALPTEPRALRAWLLKQFDKTGGGEPDDYSLFWSGRHLVFDLPVTAGTRAAAYRMLADVEGVTFLGPATDQRGRGGMAVAYTRKGDSGRWNQTRLIIDPGTGRALAEESWDLGKDKSGGRLLSYTLLLRAGFSDGPAPANLPTPPPTKKLPAGR